VPRDSRAIRVSAAKHALHAASRITTGVLRSCPRAGSQRVARAAWACQAHDVIAVRSADFRSAADATVSASQLADNFTTPNAGNFGAPRGRAPDRAGVPRAPPTGLTGPVAWPFSSRMASARMIQGGRALTLRIDSCARAPALGRSLDAVCRARSH
jgi:hypothetical protein